MYESSQIDLFHFLFRFDITPIINSLKKAVVSTLLTMVTLL